VTQADSRYECVGCGACCAAFRVSFYWAEGEALEGALVDKLSATMGCMRGTNQPAPHCAALQGRVGEDARCGVYALRPSPCREVQPGDAQCLKARARYGLP
jgi:hypothetical protein